MKPQIMGILNCTPDSFYDGQAGNTSDFVKKGLELIKEGADIIDVGGESSRPGAEPVGVDEECSRVIPVICELKKREATPLSIDTCKHEVAREAIAAGVDWVNDISAGRDPGMFELIASHPSVKMVLMHMQGQPSTMQKAPEYEEVTEEIIDYLLKRSRELVNLGCDASRLVWDPGIGFGKKLEHNLVILKNLKKFCEHPYPVLLGVSRKSFIATLNHGSKSPDDRLAGSLAPLGPAWQNGVQYFRVHDVADTIQYFDVLTSIS